MRKIRTEMYAVTYKGKLCKTPSGLYIVYPLKRDAMAYSPTHGVEKVIVTIQPKKEIK